jgi:UDP:flavonoid glycosyltransferase YjiC (YdhE family)
MKKIKVLIPTLGTRGDIQPYAILARKLNSSGFNTTIATHPCWRSLVEQYGVNFLPVGPDIDIEYEASVIRGKSKNWMIGAIKTMKFMFKIMEDASHQIKEVCKDIDLVIASHSHMGAAEAEANNIPYITVTLQPTSIPKKLEPKNNYNIFIKNLFGIFVNPLIVSPYNKLRKRLGLKKVKSFDELISPYLNIIPISPHVCPPNEFWEEKNKVVGYWFDSEREGYKPPDYLLNFVQSGPLPIVVSLGAMGFESKKEREKLDMLVSAISNAGMRGIIQGFNRTLETYKLPENIIRVGTVPHSWLFKYAYCVIHHGGFGTTASTIKAGVPSIVIPHVLDQYYWGNKVYELKLGPAPLKSKDLSQKKLLNAISTLKKNYTEISNNAKLLSKQIQTEDGLEKTIRLINDMLKVETVI